MHHLVLLLLLGVLLCRHILLILLLLRQLLLRLLVRLLLVGLVLHLRSHVLLLECGWLGRILLLLWHPRGL